MSNCVITRKALSVVDELYPDLMSMEFLSVYYINHHLGNLCGFQARVPGQRIAMLESRHSTVKDHTQKFFFISGSGRKFPEEELA